MKSYKVVKEADDHFIIDHGAGSFKVAKTGLGESTLTKIRHFADGGEVTDVEPSTGAPTMPQSADPLGPLRFAIGEDYKPMAQDMGPETGGEIPDAASTPAIQGVPEFLKPNSPDEAAPASSAAPAAPDGGVNLTEFDKGQRQALGGIDAGVAVAKAQSERDTNALNQLGQERARLQKDWQTQHAKWEADYSTLKNEVMNGKIDPNRYWSNASTGQKIGAAIGIILSGIGSGVTGQPNLALHVIDKAIDRDIDAQKYNLNKKNTLLGFHMQEGRDALAAHQMAKADALDFASTQLQASAAQARGAKAAADGMVAAGQLHMNAVGLRQANLLRSYQIQGAQLQNNALQQIMRGIGGGAGGAGFPRQVLELPAFKEYRERAVDLPDGSVGFAKDKEEATKSNDAFQMVNTLKPKLKRYLDLLNDGSPQTLDRGAAQELHADIIANISHLHDLNRLTDVDLKLFQNQVPDISRLLSLKRSDRQKLEGLSDSIDDRVRAQVIKITHLPVKKFGG